MTGKTVVSKKDKNTWRENFKSSYLIAPMLRVANKVFLYCMETICNYLFNSKYFTKENVP